MYYYKKYFLSVLGIFALILSLFLFLPTRSFGKKAPSADLSSWLQAMMEKVVEVTEQKLSNDSQKESNVAVAGLRGNEDEVAKLEPYWKGEITRRSSDYKDYQEIETVMQKGNYQKALELMSVFRKKYHESKLLPQIYFNQGLAYAGVGNNKAAVKAFRLLIDYFPQHELVEPSKSGIERLSKA
jgi:TolA-binding protein